MQKIKKEQEGLSKEITKHEDIRTKLFNDFDQEPAIIEKKTNKNRKHNRRKSLKKNKN